MRRQVTRTASPPGLRVAQGPQPRIRWRGGSGMEKGEDSDSICLTCVVCTSLSLNNPAASPVFPHLHPSITPLRCLLSCLRGDTLRRPAGGGGVRGHVTVQEGVGGMGSNIVMQMDVRGTKLTSVCVRKMYVGVCVCPFDSSNGIQRRDGQLYLLSFIVINFCS